VTPPLQFITLPLTHPLSFVTLSLTGTPFYISRFSKEVAPGIDVGDGQVVMAHLGVVGRAGVGDVIGDAMEDAGRADVGGGRLRLGVAKRDHDPVARQPQGARHFLGRDEAGRALRLLSDRRPSTPGLQLRPPLLILGSPRRRIRRSGSDACAAADCAFEARSCSPGSLRRGQREPRLMPAISHALLPVKALLNRG
jgi:hypothetical protein